MATLGIVAVLSACSDPISQAEVRAQVEAANYCQAASECVVAPGDCPFNHELVNVKEQQKVAALYKRYFAAENTCTQGAYDTRDLDRRSCVQNKCVAGRKSRGL